jgi:hypothetical protein
MPDTAIAELVGILKIKQSEMPSAPLKLVLQELVKDAAKTCTQLAKYDYESRYCGALLYYKRLYSRRIDPRRAFFDKLIAAVENPENLGLNIKALVTASGLKPGDMPAPEMARRLRVITSTIAPLLPEKSRGIAADKTRLWELLWYDASGVSAPSIAKMLGGDVNRNQIWRLRDWAYDALVAKLEPLLNTSTAAAA